MSILRIFRLPRPDLAELRQVVDELPVHVRIAMLEGVRHERLIAGAYTDDRDGVCPMLAAHRHGARYSHPDFARTWDEFAGAPIEGFRIAEPRHVEALEGALRGSIEAELRTPEPEPQVELRRPVRRAPAVVRGAGAPPADPADEAPASRPAHAAEPAVPTRG